MVVVMSVTMAVHTAVSVIVPVMVVLTPRAMRVAMFLLMIMRVDMLMIVVVMLAPGSVLMVLVIVMVPMIMRVPMIMMVMPVAVTACLSHRLPHGHGPYHHHAQQGGAAKQHRQIELGGEDVEIQQDVASPQGDGEPSYHPARGNGAKLIQIVGFARMSMIVSHGSNPSEDY
jgi:hypothetical protein